MSYYGYQSPQQSWPQPPYGQPTGDVAAKHSGLGVASFVLGLLAGLGIFILIVVAAVMEAKRPGALDNEKAPETMLVGLMAIAALGGVVLGLILGIAGLVQRDRKKLFAILGL